MYLAIEVLVTKVVYPGHDCKARTVIYRLALVQSCCRSEWTWTAEHPGVCLPADESPWCLHQSDVRTLPAVGIPLSESCCLNPGCRRSALFYVGFRWVQGGCGGRSLCPFPCSPLFDLLGIHVGWAVCCPLQWGMALSISFC